MTAQVFSEILTLKGGKLSRDIAWTFGSFGFLAISGILINIIIASFRDAAALGVFNIGYAAYIVASQFAVWGLHNSVLRQASFHADSENERGALLWTAALCTLVTGSLAAILVYVGEDIFARIFDSGATGRAIALAGLGLCLFPLNKVLLAYLNGLRRMKAFSILQSARYIVIVAFVSTVAVSDLPIENALLAFFVSEVFMAVLAVLYLKAQKLAAHLRFTRDWVRTHYAFGTKAMLAGMFAEINTRIDVLMIGFFLSDHATGIYSFAAMLVEGLYQLLGVVRINFNPVLVAALRDKTFDTARDLRTASQKYILPLMVVLAVGIAIVYYGLATWILPDKGLMEGMTCLFILLGTLSAVCFLVPFDNVMMVSGHPGYQTIQQMVGTACNVALCALLIPVFGIEGAAIGTASYFIVSMIMLQVFSARIIKWDLLGNKFKI